MDIELPDYTKQSDQVRDTLYLGEKNFMMKDD